MSLKVKLFEVMCPSNFSHLHSFINSGSESVVVSITCASKRKEKVTRERLVLLGI